MAPSTVVGAGRTSAAAPTAAPVAAGAAPAAAASAPSAAPAPGVELMGPPAPEAPAPSAPAPVETPAHHVKIGLALGGGAARGFAHVGVIKALEDRGIVPDIIVGTSVGSFVAALYASGYDGAQLQRVAMQFEESTLTDWSLPSRGLFKGQALQDFVNEHVAQRPIEKLPRKLAVVATDLGTGEMMVFERGNVGMAVRASSSVPGVFQPVAIGGHEYVDGGLVSPVPARTARRLGADVVIAVDISKKPVYQSTTGALDILLQTFTIMGQVIARSELSDADVVLEPAVNAIGSTDFAARESSILGGEQAVAAQANAILAVLARARQSMAATAVPSVGP
ncbi:MAG TPA: patatin-like phospholipase family protein [Burkholderiaceae bacterium]|nr:patatin-like phospholipase family protein [Burkholderiaceae bacterium]